MKGVFKTLVVTRVISSNCWREVADGHLKDWEVLQRGRTHPPCRNIGEKLSFETIASENMDR